jgi:hypothetical protein
MSIEGSDSYLDCCSACGVNADCMEWTYVGEPPPDFIQYAGENEYVVNNTCFLFGSNGDESKSIEYLSDYDDQPNPAYWWQSGTADCCPDVKRTDRFSLTWTAAATDVTCDGDGVTTGHKCDKEVTELRQLINVPYKDAPYAAGSSPFVAVKKLAGMIATDGQVADTFTPLYTINKGVLYTESTTCAGVNQFDSTHVLGYATSESKIACQRKCDDNQHCAAYQYAACTGNKCACGPWYLTGSERCILFTKRALDQGCTSRHLERNASSAESEPQQQTYPADFTDLF